MHKLIRLALIILSLLWVATLLGVFLLAMVEGLRKRKRGVDTPSFALTPNDIVGVTNTAPHGDAAGPVGAISASVEDIPLDAPSSPVDFAVPSDENATDDGEEDWLVELEDAMLADLQAEVELAPSGMLLREMENLYAADAKPSLGEEEQEEVKMALGKLQGTELLDRYQAHLKEAESSNSALLRMLREMGDDGGGDDEEEGNTELPWDAQHDLE